MMDIKFLREQPDLVRKSEKRRGRDVSVIGEVLKQDQKWKKELKKVESLKHTRNVVSQEINQAKKSNDEKTAKNKIKEMRSVVEEIKKREEKSNNLLIKRDKLLSTIGNILHKTVPLGKDDSENVELRKKGRKPKFNFPIKDHIELGLELDLFDLETAAEVSGSRFYYLKNEGVLLSQALQRFAMEKILKKKYTLIQPPFMLNRAALEGGVNLSEFEDTIYKIENEDLYLIAT